MWECVLDKILACKRVCAKGKDIRIANDAQSPCPVHLVMRNVNKDRRYAEVGEDEFPGIVVEIHSRNDAPPPATQLLEMQPRVVYDFFDLFDQFYRCRPLQTNDLEVAST